MTLDNKKTLLLVEDEVIIAMGQKIALEQYGYAVITAHSGKEAVEIFRKNTTIDLILMDIDLGRGIDGTQAAASILQERDIPVVFLSSHTEPDIVDKTELITSYGYVVKDSGMTVLDASIKMAFKLFAAKRIIAESEIKQKAMISNISDVIGIISTDGIMKYKSPNIEKWFGWKPDELIGADIRSMVHPDDTERIQKIFFELLENDHASSTIEFNYKCRDGSYKLVELTATNLTKDPVICGILMNYHDITQRKHIENELKNSEKTLNRQISLLTSLLKNIPIGIFMVEAPSGKPLLANGAAHTLLGRGILSDTSAQNLSEVYKAYKCDSREPYPPDKMPVLLGMHGVSSHVDDMLVIRPDGTETLLEIFGTPVADDSGAIWASLVSFFDITERKKAEKALRETQTILQAAMDNSQSGIAIADAPDGYLRYVNNAGLLIRGGDRQSIVDGIGINEYVSRWQLMDLDGRPLRPDEVPLARAIMFGETGSREFIIHRDDNDDRIVIANAAPIKDEHGIVTAAIVVFMDITERKKAEAEIIHKKTELETSNKELSAAMEEMEAANEELIATNEELLIKDNALTQEKVFTEALFESIPGYLYVYDDKGNLIRWNKKHETMTGYTAEELSQMNMSQWFEGDDALRVAAAVEEVFTKGYGEVEANLLTKGGEKLLIHSNGVRLTVNGKTFFTGVGIDITERSRAEKELRESEKNFKAIIDTLPLAIHLTVGIEQVSAYVNPTMVKLFGYTIEDIPSVAQWWPLAYPDEAYRKQVSEEWTRRVRHAIETQTPIEPMEVIVTCKDGSQRNISWGYITLGDKNYSCGLDLTEQKRYEEKIKSLLAEKELTLKEVHHRIKNNMSTIKSLLSLHARAAKEPSAVAALQDAVSRVQSMMLLYDKLYRSAHFKKMPINDYLFSLIDEIVTNFPNNASVKVEKHIDDFGLDIERLHPLGLILNELITNIMKYAFLGKTEGKLSVTISLKNSLVSVVVVDNGNGIPESIDFENSEGFGLMLVKMLTNQLDGSIRIERENGTSIILKFPM